MTCPVRARGAGRLGALALSLALLPAACGKAELQGNGRPVILISIDSLRADHCTPYGYRPQFASGEDTTPFLDRLAQEGVLWEAASAATSWTLPSHISLVTGMAVPEHGVSSGRWRLPDATQHIAGKFQDAGYRTGGVFSAPFLHPAWGFGQGFDQYLPAMDYLGQLGTLDAITKKAPGTMMEVHHTADSDKETAEPAIDQAIRWLEKGRRYEEPFFLFIHLWDPHYNYQPPREYAERFHPGYRGTVDGKDFIPTGDQLKQRYEGEDLEHILALYDAEIRYTDDQIARLWDQLEQWGIADQVVLAVTSDHGDEFYEHDGVGHHRTLYEEVVHVPMVLRAPGLAPAGRRLEGTVALYDLAPTLLDLAGLDPWTGRSGRSLRPMWEQDAPGHAAVMNLVHPGRRIFLNGWRSGPAKVIHSYDPPPKVGFRVFDLLADPGEHSPQEVASPGIHPMVAKALSEFRKVAETRMEPAKMEDTPGMREQLAEMGYTDY